MKLNARRSAPERCWVDLVRRLLTEGKGKLINPKGGDVGVVLPRFEGLKVILKRRERRRPGESSSSLKSWGQTYYYNNLSASHT